MSLNKLLQSPALDDEFFTHLRMVEPDDAQFICDLRSDPSLNQHLSQSPADVAAQREWILQYKKREAAGTEFYFVIRHQETDYGVIRMYDFQDDPKSFCWGSWIIKSLPNKPAGLASFSAMMMYEIGFDVLGFDQSHFDVRKENTKVINFHLRSGAKMVGETELDDLFVFSRDSWPLFKAACDKHTRSLRIFHG